jgi:hypothetical protein
MKLIRPDRWGVFRAVGGLVRGEEARHAGCSISCMRYQIRLLDQNLPGLTREIAQACWHAADGVVRQTLDNALYRDLYRAVKNVFRKHVQAFRFCNASRICEANIPRSRMDLLPAHEHYAGEHVHVYLLDAEAPPKQVVREIVTEAVRAVVQNLPRQPLPRLAIAVRRATEKALDQRIFRSLRCGVDHLCHANEAYDPWDLRDPINVVQQAS